MGTRRTHRSPRHSPELSSAPRRCRRPLKHRPRAARVRSSGGGGRRRLDAAGTAAPRGGKWQPAHRACQAASAAAAG
eukprot:scaffold1419_cov410-Prasinococcus_capsulatus_cf.AAC.26